LKAHIIKLWAMRQAVAHNSGLHYDKEEVHQNRQFNVYTYILPVDDIIESFSYTHFAMSCCVSNICHPRQKSPGAV
jgi:hypothetical protein